MNDISHKRSQAVARMIAGGADADYPEVVADLAKKCLADWFAVATGALNEPAARCVDAVVADWARPARHIPCTVRGARRRWRHW